MESTDKVTQTLTAESHRLVEKWAETHDLPTNWAAAELITVGYHALKGQWQ